MEGIMEVENNHLAATIVKIVWGKKYQCMIKLLGSF
jgi:hypothetical protein